MTIEELKKQLDAMEAKLQVFIDKATEEIKNSGNVSQETKTAVNAQASEAKAILDRITELEQKVASGLTPEIETVKSFGEIVVASAGYKSLVDGAKSSGKIKVGNIWEHAMKTALVNATGQNQPLVQAYRMPGIISQAQMRLTIRDLFPSVPISSNLIEYVRETTFTNNAAVQGYGESPAQYENVAKAESALAFEMLYQPVHTIAHWIPVSKQLLSDSPGLQGYINARLLYGLKLKEEQEFLNGTGSGAAISGLVTNATAYNTAQNVVGDTQIDTVRHAGGQVEDAFYPWEFTILNSADWEKIELIKGSTSEEYILGSPRVATPKMLWGRPVVPCPNLTAGKFLVGSGMAATIWDRDESTIEVSREHSDYFVKNMAAVLCEERVGMTVEVPLALVYGTFPQ